MVMNIEATWITSFSTSKFIPYTSLGIARGSSKTLKMNSFEKFYKNLKKKIDGTNVPDE